MSGPILNKGGEPTPDLPRRSVLRAWRQLGDAVTRDINAEKAVTADPSYLTRVTRLYTLANVAQRQAIYVHNVRANLGFDLSEWTLDLLWEVHPVNIAGEVAGDFIGGQS